MTRILIVEDDDAIRNNVIRLLKLEGYEIDSAINGRVGLERAKTVHPDVIITDVGMPANKVGIMVSFATTNGFGGRNGLQPASAWYRVAKC